ncbi:MAG: hypothetical protein D6770_09350 [Anaerolineae bacterium]|nr:MAG: hypothetical protein D6770_09350 [Anaerolineae bacterium]
MKRSFAPVMLALAVGGLGIACLAIPTPTAPPPPVTPPPPATTEPPATAADTLPPVITVDESTIPQAVYQDAACGPVTLTLNAHATDDSGQVTVAVQYWFRDYADQKSTPTLAPMSPQGGDAYSVTLAAGTEAAAFLGGQPGFVEFRFIALDPSGNEMTWPPAASATGVVDVLPCAAASPTPAAAETTLFFERISTFPFEEAHYGACSAGENNLRFDVWLGPVDLVNQSVQEVRIRYEYHTAPSPVPTPARTLALTRSGSGNPNSVPFVETLDLNGDLGTAGDDLYFSYLVEVVGTGGETLLLSPTTTLPVHPCP